LVSLRIINIANPCKITTEIFLEHD